MENENKKWFRHSDDRPDLQPEDTTPNLSFFFKLLKRKFGKVMTLNLFMLFQVLPLVACVPIYIYAKTFPTMEQPVYAPLLGAHLTGRSPTAGLLLSVLGGQMSVPQLSTGRVVAIALLFAFLVFTWGWQNVGSFYNLRSLVRGDSCFLFSDYFYAIRKNLVRGFFFGLFDLAVIALIGFDLYYFYHLAGTLVYGVFYILVLVLGIVYLVMRPYLYLMLITFDLSFIKRLKNALLLVILGTKRNALLALGIVILLGGNLALITLCLQFGFTLPIILPFFYLLPLLGFMAAYAAWPVIQQYMIDPPDGEKEGQAQTPTPPAAD